MAISALELAAPVSGGRGLMAGLVPALPIAATLPSVLQDDDFCVRLTSAFDEALAPVITTLDCLTAYLDPNLAPQDFADWLADWVGVEMDETWPPECRRSLVSEAISLYRRRGTTRALSRHVELYAGALPSIEDSGGCSWSPNPDSPLPGSPTPSVTVRLELDEQGHVDPIVLNRIVRANRPGHVPYEVKLEVKSARTTTDARLSDAGHGNGAEEPPETDDAPGPVTPPAAPAVAVGPGIDGIEVTEAEPDGSFEGTASEETQDGAVSPPEAFGTSAAGTSPPEHGPSAQDPSPPDEEQGNPAPQAEGPEGPEGHDGHDDRAGREDTDPP